MDGTLIESWASFKSLKRRDGEPPRSGPDGTGMVDFRGEKRSNKTHASSTDPQAKLMRKGNGQPAKLSFGAHALMENRNGLLIDVVITDATIYEPKAATALLDRRRRARQRMSTLGADKGYCNKAFVELLRRCQVAPHIARIDARRTPGLDARTTRHEGYAISQRKRKRIEEIFGWMKTVGGLRKSRFVGIAKTQLAAYMVGAAYNLLRLEGGVHRVQRVPKTETQGRIHTPTATVAVLPEAQEVDIKIDWDKDVREDKMRAGGPGGQKVNKTESAIRLTHLATGIVAVASRPTSRATTARPLPAVRASALSVTARAATTASCTGGRRRPAGSSAR